MGADMILAHCEIPYDYEGQRILVLERISELHDDAIENIVLCYPPIEDEIEEYLESASENLSEDDLFSLNDLTKIKSREIVSNHLIQAADALFGGGYSCVQRDVTEICIKDTWFAFSGGMSWGDEPTDSYQLVSLICESGITEGLGTKLEGVTS